MPTTTKTTPCPHPADQRVSGPDGLDFCPACELEALPPLSFAGVNFAVNDSLPEGCAVLISHDEEGRLLDAAVATNIGPSQDAEVKAARDLLDRLGAIRYDVSPEGQGRPLSLAERIEALVEKMAGTQVTHLGPTRTESQAEEIRRLGERLVDRYLATIKGA